MEITHKQALILQILDQSRKELYGLDIIKISNGKLKRGSVYVHLQKLQEAGLVSARDEDEVNPLIGVRRLYSINDSGIKFLNTLHRNAHMGIVQAFIYS